MENKEGMTTSTKLPRHPYDRDDKYWAEQESKAYWEEKLKDMSWQSAVSLISTYLKLNKKNMNTDHYLLLETAWNRILRG